MAAAAGSSASLQRNRSSCPWPGAFEIAAQQPLVGADDREPGVRSCVGLSFEQPLRPREPAADRRHQGGVEQQVHRNPDGRPGRRHTVAALGLRGVRALPGVDRHVQPSGCVGDLAQPCQFGRPRETVRIRLHEAVASLLPVAPVRRLSRALDHGLAVSVTAVTALLTHLG